MSDEPRKFNTTELFIIFLVIIVTVAFIGFLVVIFTQPQANSAENAGQTSELDQSITPDFSSTIIIPSAQVAAPTAQVFPTPTPLQDLTRPAATATSDDPMSTVTNGPVTTPFTASEYPRPVSEEQVEAALASLSLDQKIGQMLMIGLPGPDLDSLASRRVIDQGVGGVIFLDRNILSIAQLRDFTQKLQRAAVDQGPGLPLFIGWNHEGGDIVRRVDGLTLFPSNRAQGAAGRPEMVYQIGQAVGAEMRSLGVNMNFAPVMDVNTEPANPVIGLRSYGESADVVAEMGQQFIVGQQSSGIIAVAKHFPGHGGVDVDSHLDLPVLDISLQELQGGELQAFRAALASDVGGVMVAHLRVPQLDPTGLPTSLSAVVTGDLLRRQLAYDGVVMTDALEMNAIADNYDLGQAAVQAVLAGNDLLLSVETESNPDIMRQALLSAVQNGTIEAQTIDDAVRRLIRLKLAYDVGAPPIDIGLPNPANRQLARDAGMAAVEVIQDQKQWLPLNLPTSSLTLVSPTTFNPGSAIGDGQSGLGQALANRGVNVTELFYDPALPADVLETQNYATSLADAADAYVVVNWDAALQFAQSGDDSQAVMVRALLATGKPVIVIFGHLPYDGDRVPEAPTQMAMYGDTDGQILGVVGWLLRE